MAVARVATSGALHTNSGAALTWTHSATVGNLLTFRGTSYSAEIGSSAVTSLGGAGTFSLDIGLQAPGSGGEWAAIFSLVAPSGVTSVKSATGPTYQEAVFDEWSGTATSSPLDTTASGSGSALSGNAGTLSTGSSAGLALAALNCDYGNTTAPTSTGWTGDVNTGDTGSGALSSGFAYKVLSGAGSQQMTWTFGSTPYAAVSASYKAASVGTSATATVTGQTVTSALGTVAATGTATVVASGQTATLTAGTVTASGTSSADVLAYDQFAGTSGTALTAHTALSGQSWTMHPAIGNIALSSPPPQLNGSGGVVGEADGSNVAMLGYDAPADTETQAVWTPSGSVGSYHVALWVRLNATADTGYLVWLVADSASTYHLESHVRVAGADTSLGSTTAGAISAPSGTAVYLKLTASGTTISAAWAYAMDVATTGWRVTSWTDSSVTAAGRAGFQLRAGDPATLSDFRIQDVGTAYDASLPADSPAMAVSPASVDTSTTGNTLTVTGTNTAWTTGTTFSVSAGSITATSVDAGTQVATLTYDAPSTAQTVTLTDSADSASATFDVASTGITLGTFTVTPTYRGLSWELSYTGDDAGTATVAWTFTKSGESARNGLPAWRIDKGTTGAFLTPRAFYGKVLLCSPGTSYTIAVTVTDADGITRTNPITWTGSTLADSIPDPSTLTPTKFVAPTGSDSNDGSSGAPWLTVNHALTTAVSGDVIQFAGGGFYVVDASSQVTTANLTLLGEHAPVVKVPTVYSGTTYQQMVPANVGSRAIFFTGFYTSPTGSGDSNAGIWSSVNLTGPATSGSYQVWKCTLGTALPTSLTTCLYGATKTGDPARINVWSTAGTVNGFTLTTPAGFAEIVRTNQTHNYGIWADPSAPTNLYVRLPGDVDPNDSYLFLGHSHNNGAGTGLWVTAAGCRVSQIEFLAMEQGVTSNQNMSDLIVDTCLFEGCHVGIYSTGDIGATPTVYSDQLLAQYNLFHDTNQWTARPATDTAAIPWNALKNGVGLQAASPGNGAIMFQPAATNQPIAYQGVGDPHRITWRYNTHDGAHDTWTLGGDGRADRYNGYASDVHDNISLHHQDDGFELSQGNMMNLAIWNNVLQWTLSGMVINGTGYGPVFYFRNQHWMQGSDGEPVDHGASIGSSFPPIPGGEAVKYSTATANNAPYPRLFYLHNTLWTDSSLTATGTDGTETSNLQGVYAAAGGDGRQVHFYLRNNVIRVSGVIASQFPANVALGDGSWLDEDYDQFASSHAAPELRVGPPQTDEATITGYRTLTSEGTHSNPLDDAGHDLIAANQGIDAAFVDTSTGDLRLTSGSALVGAGVVVPNISDVLVADGGSLVNGGYYGSAPDLGSVEYAAASVDATATVTGQTLTASAGTITASGTANVAVTGQEVTATLSGVTASGAASAGAGGQTATFTIGTVSATGTATVTVTGQTATVTAGVVPASGSATAPATGQTATASTGTLAASGAATATAPALTASVLTGTVTAMTGGSATAVITGSTLTASAGAITASGAASASAGAVEAVLTSGIVTAHGGASVTLSPSTVTLSTATIAASGAATAVASPATLTATASQVTAEAGGSATAHVTPLVMAATITAVTVQANATATVAGMTMIVTAGDVLAATQTTAFVTGVTVSLATSALLASGSATAAITGALLALTAQGVTASNGLSSDIYVGGAVRANILGGAVRAPGPVPLQPGTIYGDGTYGDGLYGPEVLAVGGAVRANIVGGKVKGR